jgi:hypothetical protein
MAWSADYDDASRIITVTYRGATVGADLRAGSSAAIALSKTHGSSRYLINVTEATLSVAAIELFNLPVKQFLAEHVDRASRLAVLLPATAKERDLVAFFETVCLNYGWLVQLFEDRGEAHRWLRGEAATPPATA